MEHDNDTILEVQPPGSDAVYDSLDSFAACFCCNPFEDLIPECVAQQGQAFDAIVVQSTSADRVASSDFLISFDHPSSQFPPPPRSDDTESCQALLEVVDDTLGKVYFPIDHDPILKRSRLRAPPKCDSMARSATFKSAPEEDFGTEQGTLRLLAKMLKPGQNNVRYLFRSERRLLGVALASVFLWQDTDKLIVCDVDGTITKTNLRGIYDTIITEKYVHCHDRVCEFLTNLKKGGINLSYEENPQEHSFMEQPNVHVLYLTSRPLFLSTATRRFLSNLRQSPDGEQLQRRRSSLWKKSPNVLETNFTPDQLHRLPEGPLIGFPGKLHEVLKMELMTHDVHLFKSATLMDQVVTTFCNVSDNPLGVQKSLFVAGFGNTLMDVQAYHMAGLELSQIYLIDKKSRIHCLDAWEKEQQPEEQHPQNGRRQSKVAIVNRADTFPMDASRMDDSNDSQPTEEAFNHRPSLKVPMPRKSFHKQKGTVFQGYRDEGLVLHVLAKILVLS